MKRYTGSEIDEGLLLRALAPRPLVWVTTRDARCNGLNMAPFSAITIVTVDPPVLLLIVQSTETGGPKNTARNILATREFIVNAPAHRQLEQLMRSAAPSVDRPQRAVISSMRTTRGETVNVERLIGASYSLECRLKHHETMAGADLFFATILCLQAEAAEGVMPPPFLGALGYEWFVSEHGLSFVAQPYLEQPARTSE